MTSVKLIFWLTLLLGTAYTYYVHRSAPEQRWSWWHTLLATLLSVSLGVSAGFWVYWKQASIADEARNAQLRQALQAELSDCYVTLKYGTPLTVTIAGRSVALQGGQLHPVILDQAAASGAFDSIDSLNMLYLSRRMHTYNRGGEFLFDAMLAPPSTTRDELILNAIATAENRRAFLISNILQLCHQLELDVTNGRSNWPPLIEATPPPIPDKP